MGEPSRRQATIILVISVHDLSRINYGSNPSVDFTDKAVFRYGLFKTYLIFELIMGDVVQA